MGIAGLLPLLKKASKNSHVRKLSGCTAAVDAYCWLHKGAFGCAEKLGKGEPTTAYIDYCMKYVQVLLDNKIKPIIVLDGRNLPSKAPTEKKRREKREENKKLARKYLQEGDRKSAWECFTRCVDVTPAMAREFIKKLRALKIDYVVSPYEADAQLAYLAMTGVADIIITEDSDLVLFGCPKIFFKMNVNGDGVLFEHSKLPQCIGLTPSNFKFNRFRWMCILSGCDYLASLPGVGLGRAKKVVLQLNHDDIREMLLSIPNIVPQVDLEDITEEYIEGFIQAENTFLYQLVFDTRARKLIPLNPYPEGLGPDDLLYAGSYETREIALGLALGNIDLHSLKTVDNFEPLKSGYPATSIWSPLSTQPNQRQKKHLQTNDCEVIAPTFGMQFSVSNLNSKKNKPLTVINSDNEDENVPDDNDLMKMYEGIPSLKRTRTSVSGEESFASDDDRFDIKPSLKTEKNDSPSSMKRRKVTRGKTEENHIENSPSSGTRSKGRVVPFLKSSPEDASKKRVHVKSKYFRTETEPKAKDDEDDSSSDDEYMSNMPDNQLSNNLNIYSYPSSSQDDSIYSDISASQRSSIGGSQNSEIDYASSITKPCSVVIKKTDFIPEEEVNLIDDEDEAYESSEIPSINVFNPVKQAPLRSSSSFSVVKTPSLPVKKSSTYRRQGLSRSVTKRDPKQPSVRDMFIRHKSVQ